MSEYYVYSYLRKDSTPYYIGKGKGDRIHAKHSINLPSLDRRKVIFSNMTEAEAYAAEYMLIKTFGLKSENGLLRNQIDNYGFGGDTSKSSNYIKAKKEDRFSRKGKENGMAKLCDIICEKTGKILSEDTIMKWYAKEVGISYPRLSSQAKKGMPYKGVIVKFKENENGE